MTEGFWTFWALIIVGFLWGATNPLIKRGTKGIKYIKKDNKIKCFILEIKYLISNYKYIIPMSLNQGGSVLYFLTLQNAELSLAVPVANSLSFVFTALVGWILGEKLPSRSAVLGIIAVLVGTFLCYMDKQHTAIQSKLA